MVSCSSRRRSLLWLLATSSWWCGVSSARTDRDVCERALKVATHSKCPSAHWKDALSPLLWPNASEPLVYVNAGANKGFAVAEFMQRFHDDGGLSPSNKDWYKAIRRIKPSGMFGCGMCSACKDAYPTASVRRNVSVRIFAFELLRPNHWLLTKLFQRYGIPGAAFHAAVSNYSGTAYAPTGVRTGQEWTSAELGEQSEQTGSRGAGGDTGGSDGAGSRRARSRKGLAPVPSITIDAFAAREGLGRLHWLSVDAEGWDALILEGASQLLARRAVDVLEFEYHSKGMWAGNLPDGDRRDLRTTLQRLASFGYTCFWQGDRGGIAQASAERWCDAFEWRGHSNLVCAHEAHLVDALKSMERTGSS